jgi:copper chaperone CopZ
MDTLQVTLTGQSPLLMHNVRLANPLDPITKEMRAISSKRKKTEAELAKLAELEFLGGLYCDKLVGPYIPGVVLEAALRGAARGHMRGKDIERGVMVMEDKLPLKYKGPRDPELLFAAPEFVDVRSVAIDRKRIMRCRPIFLSWAALATVSFDEKIINRQEVVQYLEEAGFKCGLMEMRPRYGRFSVEVAI